jgi:hypothetical protein
LYNLYGSEAVKNAKIPITPEDDSDDFFGTYLFNKLVIILKFYEG